ncbi:hypothetical protein MRX96_033391 [Rhipicephalus microplus]
MVTPARDTRYYDKKGFSEAKIQEASDGAKLIEGEVNSKGPSEEGDVEVAVSTTEWAGNYDCEAQTILHATNNIDVDNDSEFQAAEAKAVSYIPTRKCAVGVDAKTQFAKSVAAVLVA